MLDQPDFPKVTEVNRAIQEYLARLEVPDYVAHRVFQMCLCQKERKEFLVFRAQGDFQAQMGHLEFLEIRVDLVSLE